MGNEPEKPKEPQNGKVKKPVSWFESEIKKSAPLALLVSSAPWLFLACSYVLIPAYFGKLVQSPIGMVILLGMFLWSSIGFLIMWGSTSTFLWWRAIAVFVLPIVGVPMIAPPHSDGMLFLGIVGSFWVYSFIWLGIYEKQAKHDLAEQDRAKAKELGYKPDQK